jgi:carbamoyltransferase
MYILGISCYFHDAAAALLCDGQLVAAAEEERFTRKKHDYEFPEHAIQFCLRAGGITAADLDYVVFFEKPFVKFERLLLSNLQTFPRSYRVFREAMVTWLSDKLWIKHHLQKRLGIPDAKLLFSEHHLSHAASTFFCSPFEEAAILTVDGVGEWATASLGVGRGTDIQLRQEIRFPHSLGLLYSAFTAFLGFEVNEGEYKVMGMAPFGQPRYVDKVYQLIRLHGDGSFELNMDYSRFTTRPTRRSIISLSSSSARRAPRRPTFSRPRAAIRAISAPSPGTMPSWPAGTNITPTWRRAFRWSSKRPSCTWRGMPTGRRGCRGCAWPAGWR